MRICNIPHAELGRLTDPKGSYCFTACSDRKWLYEDCPMWNVCYERKMYERLQWFEDRHFAEVGKMVGDRDEAIHGSNG